MRSTLNIARREFAGYFNSAIAYIVICVVLILLGVFFWQSFFIAKRAELRNMFELLTLLLVFAAPAMTMGILAEEKRSGTVELLLSMPVKDWEVIIGKYLGVMGLYVAMLLLTLPYPISVSVLADGNLDWGPVFAGYFAVLLHGGALIAIGVLASSWTENQIIAFFVALIVGGFFWLMHQFSATLGDTLRGVAQWLSLDAHVDSMARGVVDSRDVIYFLSVIAIALMLAFRSLESRRWR